MNETIKCYRVDLYDTKESTFSREYFYVLGFAQDFADAVNGSGYVEADTPVLTSIPATEEWRIRPC